VKKAAAVSSKSSRRPLLPKPRRSRHLSLRFSAVFEQLGDAHALPKKQVHSLLADFMAAMTKHLKKAIGSA
jgi:hypothetical protein